MKMFNIQKPPVHVNRKVLHAFVRRVIDVSRETQSPHALYQDGTGRLIVQAVTQSVLNSFGRRRILFATSFTPE